MNLSFLKWPIIIGAVVGIGWLLSSSGVSYMYKNYADAEVGANDQEDERNEAGLSRIGRYSLMLFKYQQALEIFEFTVDKYPEGNNVWYNLYQMVRCAEKVEDFEKARDLLDVLIEADANSYDERVPINDNLKLRRDKLVEMYDLERR